MFNSNKITIWPPTENLKIERSQYYILVKRMFKPNKNCHLTPNRKPKNWKKPVQYPSIVNVQAKQKLPFDPQQKAWKKSVLYPSKVNVQAKQKLPFDPQQKAWKLKEVSTVS